MTEFENSNAYRWYPFSGDSEPVDSDGIALATDVFVDAIMYPIGSVDEVVLSSFDGTTGEVVASAGGRTFSGMFSDGVCELYAESGRHFGTVVGGPGLGRELAAGRKRTFSLRFASACVVPVVVDCVTSLSVYGSGDMVDSRIASLLGSGRLYTRAAAEKVGVEYVDTIRFDMSQKRESASSSDGTKLKTLVVAAKGRTVFDLTGLSSSSVLVTAGGLTREDVCYQAHLEDVVSKVVDACAPEEIDCSPGEIESKSDRHEASGCSVSIVAYDLVNYRNPVKISTVGGEFDPNVPQMSAEMSEDEAQDEIQRLVVSPLGTGNGIRIEIPGAGQ